MTQSQSSVIKFSSFIFFIPPEVNDNKRDNKVITNMADWPWHNWRRGNQRRTHQHTLH